MHFAYAYSAVVSGQKNAPDMERSVGRGWPCKERGPADRRRGQGPPPTRSRCHWTVALEETERVGGGFF